MILATLYRNPSGDELNARAAIIAAAVSFAGTVAWWVIARLTKKNGQRVQLPYLFWIFGGSSLALFVVGLVGMILVDAREKEAWRAIMHEVGQK